MDLGSGCGGHAEWEEGGGAALLAAAPTPRRAARGRDTAQLRAALAGDDDYSGLVAIVGAAHRAGDNEHLSRLVGQLEAVNPTERCATSPLLDGYWQTIFASDPAVWASGGRIQHIIEWTALPNARPASAAAVGSYNNSVSPGAPGILAGPRGNRWDDVADGRGAYVQRARGRFGSSEGERLARQPRPPCPRVAARALSRARVRPPRLLQSARRTRGSAARRGKSST